MTELRGDQLARRGAKDRMLITTDYETKSVFTACHGESIDAVVEWPYHITIDFSTTFDRSLPLFSHPTILYVLPAACWTFSR